MPAMRSFLRCRGGAMGWLIGVVTVLLCVVASHEGDGPAFVYRAIPAGPLVQRLLSSTNKFADRPALSLSHPPTPSPVSLKARRQGGDDGTRKKAMLFPAGLWVLNSTVNAVAGTASALPGMVGTVVRRAQSLQTSISSSGGAAADSAEALSTAGFAGLNWTANLARYQMEQFRLQRERQQGKVSISSIAELEERLAAGVSVYNMDIRGASQPWRQSPKGELLESYSWESVFEEDARGDGRQKQLKHPVLEAIWQRVREGSKPGQRTDRFKIGLAIEGGGLRGSVTAGMASALLNLGLADAFDMVLGSSAGSIIGSYLVARADHTVTYSFFCDHLTTSKQKLNGSSWLDMGRLVDLFVPALSKSDATEPPMLLDYPMKTIMQELLPVNWTQFAKNDKHQPLKIIATGLFTEGPVVLGSQEGSYNDLASLCECVKASCMLPGVAGVEPPWLKGSSALNPKKLREGREKWMEREFSRNVWRVAKDAFTKRVRQQSPRANGTAIMRNAFEKINADGSGGIDRKNLRTALGDIGINVTTQQLEAMFMSADLDGNGLIDYNEFKALIYSLQSLDAQWTNNRWKRPKSWGKSDVEPLVDALIFEPIPYRSAVEYGCTHVLVLRSYPDGKLLPKSLLGLFERLVAPKCLDPFPEVKHHLQTSGHSIVYAEDILRLNDAVAKPGLAVEAMQVDDARDVGRYIAAQTAVWEGLIDSDSVSGSMPRQREPHLLAIAPLDADGEVSQLTLKREVLITGILQGFARAYDMLVPDDLAGKRTGYQAAVETYLPIHYKFLQELAQKNPEEKMKTGTQMLSVKWAKRRKNTPKSTGLGVGSKIPDTWEAGVHYLLDASSTFERNELVIAPRSDGSLKLARVMGVVEGEVILQVEESSERSERLPPALVFRVERNAVVGKLCTDMVAQDLAATPPVQDAAPATPLARLGSFLGKLRGPGKGIVAEGAAQQAAEETAIDENARDVLVSPLSRPE